MTARQKVIVSGIRWVLGQGYLIFRYAFPPIVAKWTRPKEKSENFILFFIAPPDSAISLELMVPQKWFAYKNFQDFMRKIARKPSKV